MQKGLKKTVNDAINKTDTGGEKLRISIIHGLSNDAVGATPLERCYFDLTDARAQCS